MSSKVAFNWNIQRCKTLVTSSQEGLRGSKDILRAAFVFAVGALDAYLHQKMLERITPFIKECIRGNRTDLMNHLVKFSEEEAEITTWDFLKMAEKARPFSHFRERIEKKLYEVSFQNPAVIVKHVRIVGILDLWEHVANTRNVQKKDIWKTLTLFSVRRNQIAHEADRHLSKRKRNIRRPIRIADVNDAIAEIQAIVDAIETHPRWKKIS